MTTKKTTKATTTTAKRPAAKKKAETAPVTPKAAAAKTPEHLYALNLGTGFTLLTQKLAGGQVTATRIPAGATLEVSYWKDPTHPQHADAKLTRITMHARLDGETLPSLVVAARSENGPLLRLAPALNLPETAKLLEYWFELETDAGHTLWDSNWGNNHWLELTNPMAHAETSAAQSMGAQA
ncbi:MAG: hypothetical protein GQE15_09880 [Archangiaceae bacterium]|nr:hypothetical protein [Archangiaceae bacterium]